MFESIYSSELTNHAYLENVSQFSEIYFKMFESVIISFTWKKNHLRNGIDDWEMSRWKAEHGATLKWPVHINITLTLETEFEDQTIPKSINYAAKEFNAQM